MSNLVHLVLLFLGMFILADARPEFTQESKDALIATLGNMREDTVPPDGTETEVGTVYCTDEENPSSRLFIVLTNDAGYLRIDDTRRSSTRGYFTKVYVTKVLDAESEEDQNSKSVLLQCTNSDGINNGILEATIVVIDVNDVEPVFDKSALGANQSVYDLQIDEILTGNVPIKLPYQKIIVFDGDSQVRNQRVTPECVSMLVSSKTISCDEYFSLVAVQLASNRYRFDIYAQKTRYTDPSYVLSIRAKNEPLLNSTGDQTLYSPEESVSISINDIQNMPPAFVLNGLRIEVFENFPVGTNIGQPVRAADQDRGDPHGIRFELLPDADVLGFEYLTINGTLPPLLPSIYYYTNLQLLKPLDREAIPGTSDILRLKIKAVEYDLQNRVGRNTQNTTETIEVRVLDVNDQAPQFGRESYEIKLQEITGPIAEENANKPFQITADIEVSDGDLPPSNSFSLAITDGNDEGMFTLDHYDGTGSDGFILYVQRRAMDFETNRNNNFVLTLTARDKEMLSFSSTAVVNITILNVNDNRPRFGQSSYSFNLPENATVNTVVGQVIATDQDPGDSIIYSLQGDNRFSIEQDGRILLVGQVDFETRSSYQVSVVASDTSGTQEQVTVRIEIINIADVGPEFPVTGYVAFLYEESFQLIPDITLQATFSDSNEPIRYGLKSVDPPELFSYFRVNPTSGALTVLQFVNYKQTTDGFISLTFSATVGNLESTTKGTITVQDINNYPPVFQPNTTVVYKANLSELAIPGDHVYTMSVVDADGNETDNGRVVFQILSGGYDNFEIGFNSGVVQVSSKPDFDYDLIKQYTLKIKGRDFGSPIKSATATLIVQIENENNKPPRFNESIIGETVKEDTANGTVITRVTAIDPDLYSKVEYSLDFNDAQFLRNSKTVLDQGFIDGNNYFYIEPFTGVLKLVGEVRRSFFDRVFFKIIAEDKNITQGQPRQTASLDIRITILASDDQAIYFDTDVGPVVDPILTKDFPETDSSQNITQIFSLQAQDPTVSRDIRHYEEQPGSDIGDYLGVSERFVYLKKELDYESLPDGAVKQISVVILAISDDRLRTGTATCIVNVLDINDNKPQFQKIDYVFFVSELKKHPFRIGSVKATDADHSSYGQVTYALSGHNSEHFQIFTEVSGGNNIGVIRIADNVTLDFEEISTYNIQVIARDNPQGSTLAERLQSYVGLTIKVDDANDNRPIFREDTYTFPVVGTSDVNLIVGHVIADDADAGKNGEVEYFIQSSTNGGASYFKIQSRERNSAQTDKKFYTGELSVLRPLDNLPDGIRIEMIILARDNPGRSPQLSGTTKVIITVSKGVKDPKPKWEVDLPATVYILEDSDIGTTVTTLTARSANESSGIEYSFVTGGQLDYEKFYINSSTGLITVDAALDYNDQKSFGLLVLATDTFNASLNIQFILTVRLIDVNNHKPSFTSCPGKKYPIPVVVSVREALEAPVYVYTAQACDLDPVAYNAMRYTWFFDSTYCNTSTSRVFSLNEDDGTISTSIKLDREVTPEYLVCVEVSEKPNTGSNRRKRDMVSDLRARDNHDTVLYVKIVVLDVNDNGPTFRDPFLQTVILEYPPVSVSVAEATDPDQSPYNSIRYSIDSIKFSIGGKLQNQPAAFSINGEDGTIVIQQNDYSDFNGGFFDIVVRATDAYNGDLFDTQTQRVFVTQKVNLIRVTFNKPADEGVETDAISMVRELNDLNRLYYKIMKISYHIIDNDQDPSFSQTDVCMVVLRRDTVLTATDASTEMNMRNEYDIIQKYGARDPGTCEPAKSVYPDGWESYWWVLVAFAIFIFILVLILIVLTVILHNQYKKLHGYKKNIFGPRQLRQASLDQFSLVSVGTCLHYLASDRDYSTWTRKQCS